jgi:hypothetical protein
LKIEAADAAVAVQDFTDQIEPGYTFRFHCPKIDFFKRDTTRCYLGMVPSPVPLDWKSELGQRRQQAISVFPRDLRGSRGGIVFDVTTERLGKSIWNQVSQYLDQ